MLEGHFYSPGASLDYGAATPLFPVEDLDATVYRGRDAELALGDADGSSVVVVTPTSMATSYHLTQHPLAAIGVESLPADARAAVGAGIDAPIGAFDLLQVGKWTRERSNRSLAEFGVA